MVRWYKKQALLEDLCIFFERLVVGDAKLKLVDSNLPNGYKVLSGFELFSEMDGLPSFFAKFPWYGGDLQTISNKIRHPFRKKLINGSKILLSLDQNGQALVGAISENTPNENSKPLVVLLHGLGGDENSIYMSDAAQYFNTCGHKVMRLNLRGAGASSQTSLNIYHAGLSDDLRRIMSCLPAELSTNGVLLMGFSLGANILLKYLGEGAVPSFVLGGVAISPPIDLKESQQRIAEFRNRFYRRYLLKKLKNDFSNIQWSDENAPPQSVDKLKSIIEFDELVIAPVYGFSSAYDYYDKSSSKSFINKISRPTLIIHAKTDPWILPRQFDDANWFENESVCTIMCDDGGHVGFSARNLKHPWHLYATRNFFKSLIC
jgi:hypothetical protein